MIYPQPARGDHCHMAFKIPGPGNVVIRIWNAKGELAAEIAERHENGAGTHVCRVAIDKMPAGVYFYKVECRMDDGRTHKIKAGKFLKALK